MKHKIVIVSYSLEIGGVERALLALLNSFDYNKVDVTLKLARKKGRLLTQVPAEVHIHEISTIDENWDIFTKPLIPQIKKHLANKRTIKKGIELAYCYICYKLQGHYHRLFKHALKHDCIEKYDIAISYAGPSSLLDYYVVNKIIAHKKIAWIHYDVDRFSLNKKSQSQLYKFFDKIFVVSESGLEKFRRKFPLVSDKCDVFHNIIDTKNIVSLSKYNTPILEPEQINILTVGRLSVEKGQSYAIKAISILVKNGLNVNLILVGGGKCSSSLKKLSDELGVSEKIHFIGETQNPYPYMAQCDIYLQPSIHEGFCITLAEAKLFGMPILATDFTGAREQLTNYNNGFICKIDETVIANNLSRIIASELYKNKNSSSPELDSDLYKLENLIYCEQ